MEAFCARMDGYVFFSVTILARSLRTCCPPLPPCSCCCCCCCCGVLMKLRNRCLHSSSGVSASRNTSIRILNPEKSMSWKERERDSLD